MQGNERDNSRQKADSVGLVENAECGVPECGVTE